MNNNTPSFGSGTNLLGASAAQVLGMPGAQQQSPASIGFQPGLLPPAPGQPPQGPPAFPQAPQQGQPMPQAPQMPPVPGGPALPGGMPTSMGVPQPQGQVGLPPGNPEALAIIKALSSRLASVSKAEELQHNGGNLG